MWKQEHVEEEGRKAASFLFPSSQLLFLHGKICYHIFPSFQTEYLSLIPQVTILLLFVLFLFFRLGHTEG